MALTQEEKDTIINNWHGSLPQQSISLLLDSLDSDLDVPAIASQAEAEAGVENTKFMTALRVLQSIDSNRALASQGEAESGADNTKMMTPLRVAQHLAANPPASGVELSDYENVVVVDAGGNGDYTSVGAALDAISDASVSNRYIILHFGDTTEVGGIVTWKSFVDYLGMGGQESSSITQWTFTNVTDAEITNLRLPNAYLYIGSGCGLSTDNKQYGLVFRDCYFRVSQSNVDTITVSASSGSILFQNCVIEHGNTTGYAIDGSLSGGEILFQNCTLSTEYTSGSVGGCVDLDGTGLWRFLNCYLFNENNLSRSVVFVSASTLFQFIGCTIIGATNSGNGLISLSEPDAGALISGCTIINTSGSAEEAIRAGSALTWGRVFHCVIEGVFSNVTPAAGTASATNTLI